MNKEKQLKCNNINKANLLQLQQYTRVTNFSACSMQNNKNDQRMCICILPLLIIFGVNTYILSNKFWHFKEENFNYDIIPKVMVLRYAVVQKCLNKIVIKKRLNKGILIANRCFYWNTYSMNWLI
jgi:hypothetical protein